MLGLKTMASTGQCESVCVQTRGDPDRSAAIDQAQTKKMMGFNLWDSAYK